MSLHTCLGILSVVLVLGNMALVFPLFLAATVFFYHQLAAFIIWIWMLCTACHLVVVGMHYSAARRRRRAEADSRYSQTNNNNNIEAGVPSAPTAPRDVHLAAAATHSASHSHLLHQPADTSKKPTSGTIEPQSGAKASPTTATSGGGGSGSGSSSKPLSGGGLVCQAICVAGIPCLSLFLLYFHWIVEFLKGPPPREWLEKGERLDCRTLYGTKDMCYVEIGRMTLGLLTIFLISFEIWFLYQSRWRRSRQSATENEEVEMPRIIHVQPKHASSYT